MGGLLFGVFDAACLLVENPHSFSGVRTGTVFVAAALLLSLVAGAMTGGIFTLAERLFRLKPTALFFSGFSLAAFVWIAIRVHVRFFFGVPLTSPESAGAYLAVFAATGLVGYFSARRFSKPLAKVLEFPWIRMSALVAALAGLLVLAGERARPAVAGGLPPEASMPQATLLLTLDTVRADHLSCYGYPRGTTPALDRLARRGKLHPVAYCAIPLTNPSHTTMMTGLLPREHGVLNNGMAYRGSQTTYVERLAAHGVEAAGFVSGIPLKAGISGLERGFQVYDDTFSPFDRLHPMVTSLALLRVAHRFVPTQFVERPAKKTVTAALEWLRDVRGPHFLWVHLYDAHSPYLGPGILRERFARESEAWSAHGKRVTEWPIADYDAELREVDRQCLRLLRAFEDRAADSDDTPGRRVVVVTSDHGEGLEQHGELTHGQLLFEEDLRVPWITCDFEDAPRGIIDPKVVSHVSLFSEILPAHRLGAERDSVPEMANVASHSGADPGDRAQSSGDENTNITPVSGAPLARAPGANARSWDLLAETFAPEGRETKSAVIELVERESAIGTEHAASNSSKDSEGPARGLSTSFAGQARDSTSRTTAGRKLILNLATGEESAYDLRSDPGEVHSLESSQESWRVLRDRILRLDPNLPALDPELERRLESLGYIH